jgi:hypothetical protein
MGCKMKLEKYFLIGLVIMLVITAIMPPQLVLADESVTITFDPTGSVIGDVSPNSFDFAGVTMGGNEDSGDFTLWNNGTVQMDTDVETNATTADMECDGDGVGGSLAENFFALQFTSTSFDGNNAYISNSSASRTSLEAALPGGGTSGTFKLRIYIDSASADHAAQSTWVNFTFTAT